MARQRIPAVRVGTRGSALALAQSRDVLKRLKRRWPRVGFSLVTVKTLGDEFQSVELFKRAQVGVFTKAIERKLLSGEIDLAVHSLKDLPTVLPEGLAIGAVPRRLDPRDVLITRERHTLESLPPGSVVGTGSPRRKRQIALARPDLVLRDMRGNLDTRVAKAVKKKGYDAVVVAGAGLERLKKYAKYARPLATESVLPAVGQAALAVQVRADDRLVLKLVKPLNHAPSERAARAERALLKALSGGCRVPVGAFSRERGSRMMLQAAVFSVKRRAFVSAAAEGPSADPEALGRAVARALLKSGAKPFLKEARE